MALLRLTGKGVIHFYDLGQISVERAREDYLDYHGYPADEATQEFSFDACSHFELLHWINTGELPAGSGPVVHIGDQPSQRDAAAAS